MNKILDTINPYLIYVPVISTAKGFYQLLSKDEALANLNDKNVSFIEPHEKAKIAISIIPFLGNFIVGIMNIAERFFPAKVNPRKDSQIPEGYELVKSDEVKTLDERFQAEIRAATIRGVESARLVVKSELEKEHQAEIDGLKIKHEAEMKAMIENQSRIPEGFKLVNEAEDERILKKLQSDVQASALKGFHAALEEAQKNGDIDKLKLVNQNEALIKEKNVREIEYKAELEKLTKELASKDIKIIENEEKINKLKVEKDTEFKKLNEELAEKKKEIEQKESSIKDLEKKLAALGKEDFKDKPAATSAPEPAITTAPSVAKNESNGSKTDAEESDATNLILNKLRQSNPKPKTYVSDAAALIGMAGTSKK